MQATAPMQHDRQVTFRLPSDLVDALETRRQSMKDATGLDVSQADVIRLLLREALGLDAKKPAKKGPRK